MGKGYRELYGEVSLYLFSLLFIVLNVLLKFYVDKVFFIERSREVSRAEGVLISLNFKESKVILRASELQLREKLNFKDVKILIKKYKILSKFAQYFPKSEKFFLKGGVKVFGKGLEVSLSSLEIDLKRGKAFGKGKVRIRYGKNLIEGEGVKINFEPFKIVLEGAKSRLVL